MVGLFIKWFLKDNPNIKAKLYTCENFSVLKKLIKSDKVLVWKLDERDHPFETCDFAAKGFWPEDVDDPKSKLIAPSYSDFKEYPIRIYEGLSTFSDYMMGGYVKGGLAERGKVGPGMRPGEDMVSFMDGSLKVGGNARTHYNVTQKQIHGKVRMSHRQPCHIIWTAHETKSMKDEFGSVSPNFGPEVVGSAATPKVPRWFENTFHTILEPGGKGKPGIHKLYCKEHYDPSIPNIPFKAQVRVDIDEDVDIPLSIPATQDAVNKFLDMLYSL